MHMLKLLYHNHVVLYNCSILFTAVVLKKFNMFDALKNVRGPYVLKP